VRQQQEINAARAAQPRVPARGGYEDAQEKGQSLTLSASSRSAIDKNDPAQIAAIAAAQVPVPLPRRRAPRGPCGSPAAAPPSPLPSPPGLQGGHGIAL
jgi:hypothetical protein